MSTLTQPETVAAAGKQDGIHVTVDNFARAETDRVFAARVKAIGIGRFGHRRGPIGLDDQVVPRVNRDTLYSDGIFDLDAGPVTITLPDPGQRFLSLIAIDEDHYVVTVAYGSGTHSFTKERVGTRYLLLATRILADPNDANDLAQVHRLQDAIAVSQAVLGRFVMPNWDPESQEKVRAALMALGDNLPDLRRMFGTREQVDPVRHLIGTATAWGGNPEHDAMYLTVVPARNDGTTVYRITVRDVPVDGFWSITVYNAKGYLEANAQQAYSLNNITAKKDADGSVSIQFGGCTGKTTNCLPIMNGWNYTVRLYRPRPGILNGTWEFPEAIPVR